MMSVTLFACSENEQNKVSGDKVVAAQTSTTVESDEEDKLVEQEHSIDDLGMNGWPTYGGQSSGTQYSGLDQVNLNNVQQLEIAWTFRTGEISDGTEGVDPTIYEMTPVFANNSLYSCTPFNHIVALDPGTGEQRWRFDPKKPVVGTYSGANYCRGVSYWQSENDEERNQSCGKRVFEGVGDGSLIAVDADTGKLCSDFGENGQIDLNKLDYKGEGSIALTSPPAIYKNVVIVGGTILDNKWKDTPDGIIRGFDTRTGKELWNWNPIPEHLSDQVGGANVWAQMSVDLERGWVFLPTGSPSYDVYGANRKEPIPAGNAVVVLNALTGEMIWSYQTVHHDLWDYDLPSMPTLATVARDGEKIPAVIQATKVGFIFVLNRLTGEPLFPVEERPFPQTDIPGEYSSPTQPVPVLPEPISSQYLTAEEGWGAAFLDKKECQGKLEKLRNEGLYTPPSLQGSILHPTFMGGSNWGGVAYDEASGLAVVNSSSMVASVTLVPRNEYDPKIHKKPGVMVNELLASPYVLLREVLLSSLGAPCNPPPWGKLTAIDMNSGKTRWQIPFGRKEFGSMIKTLPSWGSPNQGGPIITKGGLVFIGASLDNTLRAYNLQTGEEIWSSEVPAPATATPMTYEYGPEKRQYIVVAAGGHARLKTKLSDAIVAFTLKR